MKHFKHNPCNYRQVKLARLNYSIPISNYSQYLNEVYTIIGVEDCFNKTGNSELMCIADASCPGRILLDRAPFNESAKCYCWGDRSMFDFIY